ncbi:Yip1 family protein [Sulfitobacter sp. SK011]|uniref:Yip1 family protein n=1 Tax=Sulfitobacter sp. SK011 TaxID=1389004 RepID=UPI000E0BB703|nr:Yip1 family protein [Sulfitobacter sp. SK011]AXI42436.1 YIP1 family protein [Sulfitobacter sp. SK011]
MTGDAFFPLVQTTLRAPRLAAAQIIGWQLGRDVLWTALGLVAVLNTFVVVLLVQMAQPDMPLPSYFNAPLVLYVLLAGTIVVYVHAIYWAGLAIGGEGSLGDVLALVVWLQVLRAVAQIGVLVLTVLVPSLALVLSLAIAVWGLWILLNFITTALNLPTIGHAAAVLIIGAVGLVLGLGVMLSLIGLAAQGVLSNV